MRGLIFFLVAATGWAAKQQINITSTNKATVTLPASAPYSTLATFHLDWRVTVPASATVSPAWNGYSQTTWAIGGGFTARPYGIPYGSGPYTAYSYLINDYQDTPSQNSNVQFGCPTLSFGQDTIVRVQKFPAVMTCETWNVDGSNYQIATSAPFANIPGISGSLQIGDAIYNQGTMAFFRGYSGDVALGSKPPFGGTGGNLWDYEFTGNLNDSSGHGLTLTQTGTFSYSAAAAYGPACILPPQTTFRAGTALTALTGANSFPLDGGETLTYVWQQIPSNLTGLTTSTLQFSSQADINPTVQGLIAGSYTMQLTVTDSSGQHTTCSTKYGAVATDANGSVIISNPVHAQILGPMIASFASPWAAEPQQHIAYANLIIQKMTNPNSSTACSGPCQFQFFDYWNQAQAGTVTVSNGSQTVTGVGTAFQTLFCGGPGNTTPINAGSTAIVIWYPIASSYGLPSGTTGRRTGQVTNCASQTSMTVNFPTFTNSWVTDTYVLAGSGLSYAYVETNGAASQGPNGIGGWLVGAYPGNYYDNVKALYAAWYRTGIDDYLLAAEVLADRWWSYPAIDKGIPYESSNSGNPWGFIAIGHRSLALSGLFLRNSDTVNPPPYDYDPGLRTIVDYLQGQGTPNGSLTLTCPTGPVILTCSQDVREQGYALGWVALYTLYGHNSATVANSLAAVSRDMNNRWGQCQRVTSTSDGICRQGDNVGSNQTGFKSSWSQGAGNFPVQVISGSNVVTAQGGGTFSAADFLAPIVVTAASGNPMVLTLASAAPTYWANTLTNIGIVGATGTGCSNMNGPQLVIGVSGTQVTINLNGSGCTYTANSATAATPTAIWFTSTGTTTPIGNLQGDVGWYYAVYLDSTHIDLVQADGSTPVSYSGRQSGSSVGWQLLNYATATQGGNWLGYTWQPYMTGILNQSYWWVALALAASDPTNAANAATWAQNNANAMANTGLNTTIQSGYVTKGPYYAIGITCVGAGVGVAYYAAGCDSGMLGDRELNSEALNVATIAARFNPASAISITLGNTMIAAMYAQTGESGFDGANILGDLVNPGFMYVGNAQHKWFGAFWGVGADWSWASTRLGGLRPPIPRVVQVSLDFQMASQAVLTVVRPDGTSSQVTCTSSPCAVSIDSREGDHILSIKYLNPTNQVLLPAEQTIVKAR